MNIQTVLVVVIFISIIISISGCTDSVNYQTNQSDLQNSDLSDMTNSDSSELSSSDTDINIITWFSGGPMGEIDLSIFAEESTRAPYNCTIINGTIPTGFSMEGCKLIGKVADLSSEITEILQPSFWIMINDSSEPVVSNILEIAVRFTQNNLYMTLKNQGICTVNNQCSVELVDEVTGGQPPYTFMIDSFANGAPPMGMILDLQDGTLSGTPSIEGNYSFSLCAIDSVGTYRCEQTSVIVNAQVNAPSDETNTGFEEPSATVDSAICTLISKTDIPGVGIYAGSIVGTEFIFRLTGSGTATGPVGTRVYVASQPDDSGQWGTYFNDETASFTTDSWTDTGQSSGYSPDQNKYICNTGDSETTIWLFDGGEFKITSSEFSGQFDGDTVHFTIYMLYYDSTTGSNINSATRSDSIICSE